MQTPQTYDELTRFIEYTNNIFKIEVTQTDLINSILLLTIEHDIIDGVNISNILRNFLINDKTSDVEILMIKIYNEKSEIVNQKMLNYLIKDINDKYKIKIA